MFDHKEYSKQYNYDNRAKIREYHRNRTVEDRKLTIEHYSSGTNKCCIEGCNAPYYSLTLEHENFDRKELNVRLGISIHSGGNGLASALRARGFPEVGITVKCMMHNMANQHPEHSSRTSKGKLQNRDHIDPLYTKMCTICKEEKLSINFPLKRLNRDGLSSYCTICGRKESTKNANKRLIKAYHLYGYEDDPNGMSFEHSNCDGTIHKKYLQTKYRLKQHKNIAGAMLAHYLIKEYEAGVPNYPGLIVMSLNDQMKSARDCAKLRRINNDTNID